MSVLTILFAGFFSHSGCSISVNFTMSALPVLCSGKLVYVSPLAILFSGKYPGALKKTGGHSPGMFSQKSF